MTRFNMQGYILFYVHKQHKRIYRERCVHISLYVRNAWYILVMFPYMLLSCNHIQNRFITVYLIQKTNVNTTNIEVKRKITYYVIVWLILYTHDILAEIIKCFVVWYTHREEPNLIFSLLF